MGSSCTASWACFGHTNPGTQLLPMWSLIFADSQFNILEANVHGASLP